MGILRNVADSRIPDSSSAAKWAELCVSKWSEGSNFAFSTLGSVEALPDATDSEQIPDIRRRVAASSS